MFLLKSIISKSQMMFDFGNHEEDRMVHATTRHLQNGTVAQVKEHHRRTVVAESPDDEQNFYINKYKDVAAKWGANTAKEKARSFLAGSFLSREFGETREQFYSRQPKLAALHKWVADDFPGLQSKTKHQNTPKRSSVVHPASLIKSRKLHGSINFQGLPISIETGRSRIREWYNPHDGSQGMSRMTLPYGYIKGTLGTDGDAVDVFVGPDHSAGNVYVIHIMKAPDFTEYDEDKCFLGLNDPEDARRAFLASYNDPRFYGGMSIWQIDAFKEAVKTCKGKKLDSSISMQTVGTAPLTYLAPSDSANRIQAGPARLG